MLGTKLKRSQLEPDLQEYSNIALKKHRSFFRTCAMLAMAGLFVVYLGLRPEPGTKAGYVEVTMVNSSNKMMKKEETRWESIPRRSLLQFTTAHPYGGVWTPPEGEEIHELCQNVHLRETDEEKCDFCRRTSYCQIITGFVNYTFFCYCDLAGYVWLAVILLVIWWIYLFISLAVTADDFFCPAMVVIVKTLHLSPNVAGVTFLAFGNGAPDLFSAIVSYMVMRAGDAGMAIGGLFGAGMFVSACIVGTLAIVHPFKVTERPFMRDDIFYMSSCFWMLWIIWREKIFLGDAIGYVLLYVFYVLVVIISGSMYKKQVAKKKPEKLGGEEDMEIRMKAYASDGKQVYTNMYMHENTPAKLQADLSLEPNPNGEINLAFEGDSTSKMGERKMSMDVLNAVDHKIEGANDNKLEDLSEGVEDDDTNYEIIRAKSGEAAEGDGDSISIPSQLDPDDMPVWWKQVSENTR